MRAQLARVAAALRNGRSPAEVAWSLALAVTAALVLYGSACLAIVAGGQT